MAIMPATLRQGQKLLAGTIETARSEVPQEDLRLDYAIASITWSVGNLYRSCERATELVDEHMHYLSESVAMAMDLSGTELEKLQATTSRDKHQALVGLHSLTSEMLFFYGSNTTAFELTLQRIWAYLVQHCSTITGKPIDLIVGRS